MRGPQVLRRADGDDPRRIYIVVSEVVVALDVIEIHRAGDSLNLIKITQVTIQVRIINDSADVAFKMSMVDRIEPDQCDKKSPICFQR